MNQANQGTLLLSPADAAAQLGCSRTYLYQLLRSGELNSIHLGRLRRIPLQDLVDFVALRAQRVREARASALAILDLYRNRRGTPRT